MQPSMDERYTQWKSVVPVLYDWLANHNLVCPSLSCRWWPQLEQATYKNSQHLYLSERTDGTVPNTLVIATCEIVKPRVAADEHISLFDEKTRSPFVKMHKTIIHPGEVLIWDIEKQPNRHAVPGVTFSRPDLILTGHMETAKFALAMSSTEPFVLSGGQMYCPVEHPRSYYNFFLTSANTDAEEKMKSGGHNVRATKGPSIGPRGIYKGHSRTVEDVQFCPLNAQEFCSVGDDSCLMFWAARVGSTPVLKVEKAHDEDVHCVDWNSHDTNFILTGSADNAFRMFDPRNLSTAGVGSPVYEFKGHDAAVVCVQVQLSSVFSGVLTSHPYLEVLLRMAFLTSGTMLRDKVVDFHWNGSDPWTIASVSDDCQRI